MYTSNLPASPAQDDLDFRIYTYMCMHIHKYVYIHVYAYTYICIHVRMYTKNKVCIKCPYV